MGELPKFLEGKMLAPPDHPGQILIANQGQVRSVSVENSLGPRIQRDVERGTDRDSVNLIVQSNDGEYAVHGEVEYKYEKETDMIVGFKARSMLKCERVLPVAGLEKVSGYMLISTSVLLPGDIEKEVRQYLDGKTIMLPQPEGNGDKAKEAIVLKEKEIPLESVKAAGFGLDFNKLPQTGRVQLIAKTEDGEYSVTLEIQHKWVLTEIAFFGIKVESVVRKT